MELSKLLSAMPGAIELGLIWGIMAIGVFITYKVLDFADLTCGRNDGDGRRGVRYADAFGLQSRRRDVRCSDRRYACRSDDRSVPFRDGHSRNPLRYSDAAFTVFD